MLIRTRWPESTIGLFCGRPATFLLGLYLLVSAFRDYRKRKYVQQNGVEVTGEVKEIKRVGRSLYPVVEFCLPDNSRRIIAIQQRVNLDWRIILPSTSDQQKVTLRYILTNPTDAFIYTSITVWLDPLLGAIAGVSLFLTLFYFSYSFRGNRFRLSHRA
jgi:hypothetical protein